MKLKEIAIVALYNDYDCSVELKEGNMTFLHSMNGTGKSTILKMVNAVFNNDGKYLLEVPFKKMTLTFDNGTIISVNNRDKIECVVSTKEHDDAVALKDIKGFVNVIHISPERAMLALDDGRFAPAIDSYIAEFTKMCTDAKNCNSLSEPKKLITVDDERFVLYCQNLKAKMDYIGDAGITVKLPADIKFPPNRYEYSENKDKYVRTVSALTEWVDANYRIAESFIIFFDVVNKLFSNKDLSIDNKNNMRIMVNGRTPIPVNALSAGEKQILIMFYRLLFHAKDGSLVFIDEPEISLHVTWQQSLGSIFQDIARVRDLQLIVATHSPQIIHDKWDLATELRSERA